MLVEWSVRKRGLILSQFSVAYRCPLRVLQRPVTMVSVPLYLLTFAMSFLTPVFYGNLR